MNKFLKIHSEDNVIVALETIEKGAVIRYNNKDITISEDIPQGHKIAIEPISKDEPVVKYGRITSYNVCYTKLLRSLSQKTEEYRCAICNLSFYS